MTVVPRSSHNLYRLIGLIVTVGSLLLIACSDTGSPSPTPTFTAEQTRGRAVYESTCARCHSTIPGDVVVGPSLAGIASRAANRVPGLDARAYITQSIMEPDAYVVDGYPDNQMPEDFPDQLSSEDLHAVVAYLLTLSN